MALFPPAMLLAIWPRPQITTLIRAAILLVLVAACSNLPEQASTTEPAAGKIADEKTPEPAEVATRPFPDDSFYDLLVAEFAVRRNRYDLALGNYLQQAHQTRDIGVTARATRLAQFLQADKATLDAAQLWLELQPDNAEAQYTTATVMAKMKRPLEALEHMAKVLEQDGKTNFAAIVANSMEQPEEILKEIEKSIDHLISKHPTNTQLLISKSLLLQQRGKTASALTLIRQVLVLDENDLHAVVVEARLLQQLKRGDEAFTRLQQAVQRFPDNRRLRLQYARILMASNISLAKEQFVILLAESPSDPDLLLSLALISKETNQLGDAKGYLERLLTSDQRTTPAHFYLGQIAELEQNLPAAIDHYKAIPPGADFITATNRITYLYLKQGEIVNARQYLQELRRQHPKQGVRLFLVESELLLSQQLYSESYDLLSQALQINPQQPNLLYARALVSERVDNIAQMEQDLKQIIAMDSDNAIALNTLGYVLTNRSDRYDEAYQLISRALAVKPADPAILDSLGWVEFRRGNLTAALNLLTRAYQAFPDHEVAAHLGEVLWHTGQIEQAVKLWQQALQRKPDSAILQSVMQRLAPDALPSLPANEHHPAP